MASFTVVIKPVPDKMSSVDVLAQIIKFLPAECTPLPNSSGERFNRAFINFLSLSDALTAIATLNDEIVWCGPLTAVLQNSSPIKQPNTVPLSEKSQHESVGSDRKVHVAPTVTGKHHPSKVICRYDSECNNVRCERDRKYLPLLLMY